MAILINEQTRYLIQGITGKQGQLACEEMLKEDEMVNIEIKKHKKDFFGALKGISSFSKKDELKGQFEE